MVINRSSLREQVKDAILQRIGSGELGPNDRVVEMKLAHELGVSSIPVREAIRELVAMGVLESIPHKGARVRDVSIEETIDALQARSAIEPLAVSLAGDRLRSRCEVLRAAVAGIAAAAAQRDYSAYQRENQKFHRTIVEASGNGVLLKLWDSLAYEVRARAIMEHIASVDPQSIAGEHAAVLEAIEAGQYSAAGALLSSHSWNLAERLRKEMAAGSRSIPTIATDKPLVLDQASAVPSPSSSGTA